MGIEELLNGLFDLLPAEREHLARRLKDTPLRRLAAKSFAELKEWLGADPGNSPTLTAERLLLLFEICRRFGEERLVPGVAFTQGQEVFRHFRMRFRDLKQERFLVVLLDVKKRYLGDVLIAQGSLDSAPAHPRDVFAAAVRERAAAVLLVHNHPSGDPTPSQADLDMTRELAKLGNLMGIPVLDHIILGDERFVSMHESGLVDL
jgi:DNA repair protein RadC